MKSTLRYIVFIFVTVALLGTLAPSDALARRGGDENNSRIREDNRGRGRGGDDARTAERRVRVTTASTVASTSLPLEVEADIFTDRTIIKVEMENGQKITFESDADTRDEVLNVIVDRTGLSRSEVDRVLNLEVENRATRARERSRVTDTRLNVKDTRRVVQTTERENRIRDRVEELEDMIDRLMALLNNTR
jgi:hypothetical protein